MINFHNKGSVVQYRKILNFNIEFFEKAYFMGK